MTPITRRMRVIRAPSTDREPMIRIKNKFLENFGFPLGAKIEVTYQLGTIIINKINNEHINTLQINPLAVSGGAEAVLQRSGQAPSGSSRNPKVHRCVSDRYPVRRGPGNAPEIPTYPWLDRYPMHTA